MAGRVKLPERLSGLLLADMKAAIREANLGEHDKRIAQRRLISQWPHAAPEVSPGGLASLINVTRRAILDMGSSPQDVGAMVQDMLRMWSLPVPPSLSRQIPKQMTFEDYPLLEGRL